MKVFIKEYCRDVIVRIYGIDGEERTKEYFEKYFENVEGVYPTTDEEKESYNSEAVYTITKAEYYNFFEAKYRDETVSDYTFDTVCYVI